MKIGLAIRELHGSERNLAVLLRTIAARHQADSGIYYVALDLAVWSDDHLRELAEHGRRQGLRLSARRRTAVLTAPLQSWIADVLRRRPEPTLMLLADLRRLHRAAAGVSLDWELLGQAAQAAKDQGLLD